ncbi:hypothetical protein BDN72DRAFT_850295 [Pluteus cervinus]|uniref:Uncharacterized protein n=1 Tax=Pluteus cervinus TaxID=181527 RepID=A0ACD3A4Q2_9AGAR|nr:hypothetical protein BDN72DRAFT_850295 [Pluteus cervinus]
MDPLAPELINLIFQHVQDDYDSRELADVLRNCCLVSHGWREIAQPILFSEYPRFRQHPNKELFQTLHQQPHLQSHIKNLCIQTKLWFELPIYETVFCELAPGLKTLVITNQWTGGTPLPIAEAIVSCLSTNILTGLSFSGVTSFPISIFYQLPHLRDLHLHASTISGFSVEDGKLGLEYEPTPTRSEGLKPKLDRLFIEEASLEQIRVLHWFMSADCAFDLSELKTFYGFESPRVMGPGLEIYTICQKFVNFVASSLLNLALDPNPAVLADPVWFKFEPLPHLRSIRLSLQNDYYPLINLLPWVTNVLNSLSHPTQLEYLDLPCRFYGEGPIDLDPSLGWHQLDNFLVSGRFPNFKRVSFGAVRVFPHENDRMDAIVNGIPFLLPRLSEKGLVIVTNSPVIGYLSRRDCWYWD